MSERTDRSTQRPNVIVVVFDDLGFSDLGCFGSRIATPTIDRIAAEGLRYNNFHVTPMCSPTRACVLTGRNHHAVGMGMLADIPSRFPAYTARIPESATMLPRHLRDAGYATFAVGKWHLVPQYECGPSGPIERWPLARGFDRFYGFLSGCTDSWYPQLVRDTSFVEQPQSPENGYHVTQDLVSEAIGMIDAQQARDPEQPFFLYLATGAMHVPHQAPSEYIERYRGAFDEGWDAERDRRYARQRELGIVPDSAVNTERPSVIPAWDDLSADEQRMRARQMELYAGFLTHTDDQLGRLVDHLRTIDAWDDTIVLLMSDNGASAEGGDGFWSVSEDNDLATSLEHLDEFGGPGTFNHYASGWAWAGNTPFRYWKYYTWLGGTRSPLVVRWPDGIRDGGEVRSQFAHAIDLLPTILDTVGVSPADEIDGIAQLEIEGRSVVPSFSDADAPSPRDSQYFEMWGSRSMYAGGWKATTDHVAAHDLLTEGSRDFETDRWALFDLTSDFTESRDLAEAEPDRLAELIDRWQREADRLRVLPLMDSIEREEDPQYPPHPLTTWPRSRYVCQPGQLGIEVPNVFAIPECEIGVELRDAAAARGVLFAFHHKGASFHLPVPVWTVRADDGILSVSFPGSSAPVRIPAPLSGDPARVVFRYRVTGHVDDESAPAELEVSIDGEPVLSQAISPRPRSSLLSGLDVFVGRGHASAVGPRGMGDHFTGRIDRLTLDVGVGAG